MRLRRVLILGFGVGLGACSMWGGDRPKTLAELEEDPMPAVEQSTIQADRKQAIGAYRRFLEDAPEDSPLRVEALRRVADLNQAELDDREAAASDGEAVAPGKEEREAVIAAYSALLARYPDHPRNAEIRYQLARAYSSNAQTDQALVHLNRLAAEHPNFDRIDEVQFRRGEALFVRTDYAEAADAYAQVIEMGAASSFYEQALYKRGWSMFKQNDFEAAMDMFVTLMDRRVEGDDIPTESLSPVEQERLQDTLRVMALSFNYLGGQDAIAAYFNDRGERPYEHLIYDTLGSQYLEKERFTDAVAVYQAFVERQPAHKRAPYFLVNVIAAYQAGGFTDEVLEAKRDLLNRYGLDQPWWTGRARSDHPELAASIRGHLSDLSRHHHALAQETKKPEDYQQAIYWYRKHLAYFPGEVETAEANFLLAELLFETQQFAEAAEEYERTAYNYPVHPRAAEAGYAALLAYDAYGEQLPEAERASWHRLAVGSALRFADTFQDHPQAAPVLTKASEDLYQLGELNQAQQAAEAVLSRYPNADIGLHRTAWTVVGHTSFELGDFLKAENGYQRALALTNSEDEAYEPMRERLAASVYKQGEAEQKAGNLEAAVDNFLRVAVVAPGTSIHPTAQYDAGAVLMQMEQWARAAQVLEAFRADFPDHPLQDDVTEKLAVAYVSSGQPGRAAGEFARIAETSTDPTIRREAAWRAAELYQEAGDLGSAIPAWENYVAQFPQPVEPAIEARYTLLQIYQQQGNEAQIRRWREEIIIADAGAGSQRTARTRFLAGNAQLALAEELMNYYRSIRLEEPLDRNLQRKREAMEETLAAFGDAADYNLKEVTTASTYYTAEIYRDFGKALMESERPSGLDDLALEEYELMLEEEAFPFEEKAIDVHDINAARTVDGVYDEWVKKSFERLANLMPARYRKEVRDAPPTAALR